MFTEKSMVTNKTLFKATGTNARACHGGYGKWYKPHSYRRPGKWMEPIKDIYPCWRGYHVCEGEQILNWLNAELYEVEIRGEQIREDDKIVAQQARLVRRITTWNTRTARLFACDCAEHVLHLFEEKYPEDKRPAEAIAVARRHARGEATEAGLKHAFCATARAVDACHADCYAVTYYAVEAAYYAVRAEAAESAADVYYAAANAADAAATAAAYASAAVAAVAAVAASFYTKEYKWQYKQLLKYLNGEIS